MIEFDRTSYSYGAREIISRATLSLSSGSMHFLTGPSGAGKTTFLKLCYRALVPTEGDIRIFGQPTRDMERDEVATLRQRIGVVHQDCRFLDHLSVAENVVLPLLVSGLSVENRGDEVSDLLSWVALDHRAAASPAELSGGERQRLALARAVILSPDIIVADEPTGNIDWEMGQRLMALLIELNRLGKTIVLATHDLNLIRATRDKTSARVLRIQAGELRQSGSDL